VVPNSSHGLVFPTTAVDEFQGDVQGRVLNSRTWVFHERVLARRTVHFTKWEPYFECGGGLGVSRGRICEGEWCPLVPVLAVVVLKWGC